MAIDTTTMDGSLSHLKGTYYDIKFQDGPIQENGVNGTQIEDIIMLLSDRLEGFQKGPFRCEENGEAIDGLLSAWAALDRRRQRREEQGVEGKNEAHVS